MNSKGVRLRTRLWWLCIVILGVLSVNGADEATPPLDQFQWLISSQLELYRGLLADEELPNKASEQVKWRFHRFAFEFWLQCKSHPNPAILKWRQRFRQILHTQAKSPALYADPGGLLKFFVGGKLVRPEDMPPIRGIEQDEISEGDYKALIEEFKAVYCDLTEIFPPDPAPTKLVRTQTAYGADLEQGLQGRKWTWVSTGRLPAVFATNPIEAFDLLTVDAQAYFLPAFMRMCEQESNKVEGLAIRFVQRLGRDDVTSALLRSRLSDQQKRVFMLFFQDWLRGDPNAALPLEQLRRVFAKDVQAK